MDAAKDAYQVGVQTRKIVELEDEQSEMMAEKERSITLCCLELCLLRLR